MTSVVSETKANSPWQKPMQEVDARPYDIRCRLKLAKAFAQLDYPDLASGEAYMALMLLDELHDEEQEFYEEVETTNRLSQQQEDELAIEAWNLLVQSLSLCGDYKAVQVFQSRAARKYPHTQFQFPPAPLSPQDPKAWEGRARREVYDWNHHEPCRTSNETVAKLNAMLASVAPKLQVKPVRLPSLCAKTTSNHEAAEATPKTSYQLGVFATQDLAPGETVLDELSLLTASSSSSSSSLVNAYCDACSASLSSPTTAAEAQQCPGCVVVLFCSARCRELAQTSYHTAVCGVDSVVELGRVDGDNFSNGNNARVPAVEASTALYGLLLFRVLAMAFTQRVHPLELDFVRYIWGDFGRDDDDSDERVAKSLPFSFHYNVFLPLTFVERVLRDPDNTVNDINNDNIFTCSWARVWVFNTVLAKLRGTASARQGPDGRPEVGAVHPLWSFTNHDCDPNVSWNWDGSIKFKVRDKQNLWNNGVKAGQEVLSHYCDIVLPVDERRAWARGALGGECMCDRCVLESHREQLAA